MSISFPGSANPCAIDGFVIFNYIKSYSDIGWFVCGHTPYTVICLSMVDFSYIWPVLEHITPWTSGCPEMEQIRADILKEIYL